MRHLAGRRRLLGMGITLATAGLLGGCGQRGPLYLPQEEEKKKKKNQSDALPSPIRSKRV